MDNLKIASILFSAFLLPCLPIGSERVALGQIPQSENRLPEQLNLEAMIARQNEYVEGLASSVKNEKRDESWALLQEGNLRSSFASQVGGDLESIDCHTTRCGIEINLAASESPKAALDQQMKITKWISVNADCGYILIPGQRPTSIAASKVRIYLDCARH